MLRFAIKSAAQAHAIKRQIQRLISNIISLFITVSSGSPSSPQARKSPSEVLLFIQAIHKEILLSMLYKISLFIIRSPYAVFRMQFNLVHIIFSMTSHSTASGSRLITHIHIGNNFIITIFTFINLNTPRITIHHKNGKNKLGISKPKLK